MIQHSYTNTNEWMKLMFDDTPARKTDRLLGVRKREMQWNGYQIKTGKNQQQPHSV